MDKRFGRAMSMIALGLVVWLSYEEKQIHWSVYGILGGVIFQASSGDILQAIKLIKGLGKDS